jgi:hypothetical protein
MEGSDQLSQEDFHSSSVNGSVEEIPEVTHRPKGRKLQSGGQLNTAEFRVRMYLSFWMM